jgi:hypothetical protein
MNYQKEMESSKKEFAKPTSLLEIVLAGEATFSHSQGPIETYSIPNI